ncbi:MAG: hypothetical protein C0621_08090 [Desulfuromonas sp.]|nr:MAG: hypothetical protein C0621_08090 [Desulfuromonas sp.]
MLSRVAESIYWMNRYIERAENVARFIDANFHMILDLPRGASEQWQPLVNTTGDHEVFAERYGSASRDKVIEFLAFDRENPNSILSCLRAARENARSVREYISSEMWQQLNTFYLTVNDAARDSHSMDLPHQFFVDIMMSSHLFVGVTESTMSHGEGWHFGRVGRMIERADKTSRILDVKYYILLPSVDYIGTPFDSILWGALLRSASAFEMYLKRHGRIDPEKIADFLLLDTKFPRAIHSCLNTAEISMRNITGQPRGTFCNRADRTLGKLLADMDYTTIEDVLDTGLHEYLDQLQSRLNQLGGAINDTFFTLRPVAPTGEGRAE